MSNTTKDVTEDIKKIRRGIRLNKLATVIEVIALIVILIEVLILLRLI